MIISLIEKNKTKQRWQKPKCHEDSKTKAIYAGGWCECQVFLEGKTGHWCDKHAVLKLTQSQREVHIL